MSLFPTAIRRGRGRGCDKKIRMTGTGNAKVFALLQIDNIVMEIEELTVHHAIDDKGISYYLNRDEILNKLKVYKDNLNKRIGGDYNFLTYPNGMDVI